MFGLSHVVRQRLNASLTINTRTSDTGAPRQTELSLFLALAIWKNPQVMTHQSQHIPNQPSIIYLHI